MNTNLNMQTMPIDRLKPAKYNPRKDLKPGDPAYEKIKRSLHDFGYVDPIVWNEVTGNIVGGHQRYKVLKAEGATEVDCVVVHIENPSDEKALNIALNKATGDWEPTALADLLQDLQSAGYDLGATGFDAAEVDDLFSKVHDKDVHDDDCEIDPETVNLSWILETTRRATFQQAYELTLKSGSKTVWRSGKVESDNSVHVPLGVSLQPSTDYTWTVKVWDNHGQVSKPVSASFSTALAPGAWKAAWIGTDTGDRKICPAPIYFRKTVKPTGSVKRAVAYVTSRGIYELRIDGSRVGDDYLTPGWTAYQKTLQAL